MVNEYITSGERIKPQNYPPTDFHKQYNISGLQSPRDGLENVNYNSYRSNFDEISCVLDLIPVENSNIRNNGSENV
jgi:hypothetical protein